MGLAYPRLLCVLLLCWHWFPPLSDRALKKQMQLVQNTRMITTLNVHILQLFLHMFWQGRELIWPPVYLGKEGSSVVSPFHSVFLLIHHIVLSTHIKKP